MVVSSCTILWSTQSGRAKACARRAARLIRSRGGKIISPEADGDADGGGDGGIGHYGCTFDDYGPSEFLSFGRQWKDRGDDEKPVLIMFVSTTGDAEHCDPIRSTWSSLLRRSLPSDLFSSVRFALFALGDRAYGPSAYCAAGRKLAARLVQLGAAPFCDIGYGDDGTPNGGVFADLDEWLEGQLLPQVGERGAALLSSMPKGCSIVESPYKIEKEVKGTASALLPSDIIQEWCSEKYRPHYDKCFASLCPATAYRYNPSTGKRCQTNKSVDARTRDPPMVGRVLSNERITAQDWTQDTRHIRIQVISSDENEMSDAGEDKIASLDHDKLPYQAGDVATIQPSNSVASVERFLSVLPASVRSAVDEPICISPASPTVRLPTPWPERCTLRGLLTHCADINSLPEREDLRALAAFCHRGHPMGSDHAEKLVALSETKSAALYGDYILREKRNWSDVLFDFDSIRYEDDGHDGDRAPLLTAEQLLAILPPILPRHFSIASSPSHDILAAGRQSLGLGLGKDVVGNSGFGLDLCVAIVEGKTIRGRPYEGLCSGYLSRLIPSKESEERTLASPPALRVWIRPGSFGRLPLEPSPGSHHFATPIMCIGAGTGVAPLRSLVLERDAVWQLRMGNGETGRRPNNIDAKGDVDADDILVFGCRKRASDFYYSDDWAALSSSPERHGSFRLLAAFSRDQRHKLYVQRVVREADGGRLLARHILERKGAIYVAGGAKMAQCVRDELLEALSASLVGGEKDAKLLLRKMQREGKFSVEAWS